MAETYDLRETFSLRALYQDIEPRHGITWRTRKHSLSGFEMTDERANEFIKSHRAADEFNQVGLCENCARFVIEKLEAVKGKRPSNK